MRRPAFLLLAACLGLVGACGQAPDRDQRPWRLPGATREGVAAPAYHDPAWAARHPQVVRGGLLAWPPVSPRLDRTECRLCHQAGRFCAPCHAWVGVDDPGGGREAERP